MATLLVIVSYKVFPAQMGGQKGIVHFYKQLQQHHSIHMAVSRDNETVTTPYPVHRILFIHRYMLCNLFRLRALAAIVKKHQIECVIAEHSYTGWIAWLLKKWTGKPFILHSHNIEASRFRQMKKRGWRVYAAYEKWIHRKAAHNFFKTEEDRAFAIKRFSLDPERCGVLPYGATASEKIENARESLRRKYNIQQRNLFYFNGTLNYAPNRLAVKNLLENINPLLKKAGVDFIILISGKDLPAELLQAIEQEKTIRYLAFVEDIELFYQGATLFLNPVLNDAGVKTKLVEALANSCTVISTTSGATGIPPALSVQKLIRIPDGNWQQFVDAILQRLAEPTSSISTGFLAYFSWAKIAQKAADQIQETINHA